MALMGFEDNREVLSATGSDSGRADERGGGGIGGYGFYGEYVKQKGVRVLGVISGSLSLLLKARWGGNSIVFPSNHDFDKLARREGGEEFFLRERYFLGSLKPVPFWRKKIQVLVADKNSALKAATTENRVEEGKCGNCTPDEGVILRFLMVQM